MPIIKSAKKRVRLAARQHDQNLRTKRNMRNALKAFAASVADGDKGSVMERLKDAQSALDTAVKKNVIHRNKAARRKSQLSAAAKAVSGTAKKAAPKKAASAKPAAKPPAKKPAAKKAAPKKAAKKS